MKYLELKSNTKKYYQGLKPIYSPAINDIIYFNSKGFNHITFRSSRNPRPIADQISRMKIIDVGVRLIKKANIYQEFEKIAHDNDKVTSYWGIIAILENIKIKVIIRSIGNGQKHFWSIIPAYSTSEKRDKNFKMKGDPEND